MPYFEGWSLGDEVKPFPDLFVSLPHALLLVDAQCRLNKRMSHTREINVVFALLLLPLARPLPRSSSDLLILLGCH